MKKVRIFAVSTAASLFVILISLLPSTHPPAHADVGELPMPGAMITTGDTTEDIEMRSEYVEFEIHDAGDDCPLFSYEGCWYAHVTASFYMYNTSTSDVSMDLFYPYPSMMDVWGGYGNPEEDQSIDFEVTVDDVDKAYTTGSYSMEYDGEETDIPSLTFPVTFPADEGTEISISYDTRLVSEPKSYYGTFIYIMQTGSHWAGPIGEGTITFSFPEEINESIFMNLPENFEIFDDELTWDFTDLEPDAEDDISITFSPELLDLWNDRESYLEGITSSVDDGSSIPGFLDDDMLPEGYYQIVPSSRIAANAALFLTDPVVPGESEEEYYPNWGWLAPLGEETAPFVEYELDAVYEVSSIDVYAGIPIYVSDTTTWEEVELNTLLDRPKELTLTFSDGTETTVTLTDAPEELQTVEFDAVETSSVKVAFTDTYPGDNGGGEVLGISRMYLGVGEKIREKDVVTEEEGEAVGTGTGGEEEVSEDSFFAGLWHTITTDETVRPIVIVVLTAIVMGVWVTIWYSLRKKGGKKETVGGSVEGGKGPEVVNEKK